MPRDLSKTYIYHITDVTNLGTILAKGGLLSDVASGLRDLVDTVQRLGIESIAIPPLGCGNGGLNWADVRPLIEQAFAALPHVQILLFEPAGAPAAATTPTNPLRRVFLRLMEIFHL